MAVFANLDFGCGGALLFPLQRWKVKARHYPLGNASMDLPSSSEKPKPRPLDRETTTCPHHHRQRNRRQPGAGLPIAMARDLELPGEWGLELVVARPWRSLRGSRGDSMGRRVGKPNQSNWRLQKWRYAP